MEKLDRYDIQILNELQADARLTNAELAQRVGLSAAPCWRRVRALEEAGYIKGYHAEIDRHKIGLGVLAFVRLDADRNTGERTKEMEEAIGKIPEIVSCHYISGAGTFELQVVSRDLNTFSQFAREVLINLPNVKDVHTSFSLGEVKASSALPLGHLLIEVRQVQFDDSQRSGVELGNRSGVQMNQSRNSGSATQQAMVLN